MVNSHGHPGCTHVEICAYSCDRELFREEIERVFLLSRISYQGLL